MSFLEQIPDSAKVITSLSAPVATYFGFTLEDWTFILSTIVSLLFIVEKFPVFFQRIKQIKDWIKKTCIPPIKRFLLRLCRRL